MSAKITAGVVALEVVGLQPGDFSLPPLPLYGQSPERFEFFDITDITQRYHIGVDGLFHQDSVAGVIDTTARSMATSAQAAATAASSAATSAQGVAASANTTAGAANTTAAAANTAATAAQTAVALKADKASPTFTGTPLAPTAAADTNSTQLATTGFVLGQLASAAPAANGTAAVGTSKRTARGDHVHPTDTTRANVNQVGSICAYVPAAANGELVRTRAPYGFTLTKIEALCAAGSITVVVNINGTPCTGGTLSATTANSSSTITAANTYVAGQDITLVGSSASSCTGLMVALTYTRVLAA